MLKQNTRVLSNDSEKLHDYLLKISSSKYRDLKNVCETILFHSDTTQNISFGKFSHMSIKHV